MIFTPSHPYYAVIVASAGRFTIGPVLFVRWAPADDDANADVLLRFDAFQTLTQSVYGHGFTRPGATITPRLSVFGL